MKSLKHQGLYLLGSILSCGVFIATLAGVGNGLYRLNGALRDASGGDAASVISDAQRMVSSVSVYFIWSLVFLAVTAGFVFVTARRARARTV